MNHELNKPDLLFRMMEQPQRYTADEWQAILADDECRELYTLMSKTQSAFDAVRADEMVTDEVMDAEWKRLENKKITPHSTLHTPHFTLHTTHATLHHNAATFIGNVLVTGMSLAAIQLWKSAPDASKEKEKNVETTDTTVVAKQTPILEESVDASVTYDNVPLEKMLSEIAAHYGVEAIFQSDSVRQLRFHFVWNREQPIDKVIENLNRFERLHVTLKHQQLIVE